jgi:hypothetical protein
MIYDVDTNELFQMIGELYVEKTKATKTALSHQDTIMRQTQQINELNERLEKLENGNSKVPTGDSPRRKRK